MSIDTLAVADLMRQVAAEEVLPRFRNLDRAEIREKRPGDLVTVADEAAERALSRRLRDLLPGSLVVGEEAVARDAGVLAALGGEEAVWIVDPIDGTHNFVAGNEAFGVIVALMQGGAVTHGWILDIPGDRMAIAEAGAGAQLGLSAARVAPPEPFARMRGRIVPWLFKALRRPHAIARLVDFDQTLTLNCCAHEYLLLATGGLHFAAYRTTNAWDHAAGWLIHGEAGGHAANFAGEPWHAAGDPRQGLLLAPDAASWQSLHAHLFLD